MIFKQNKKNFHIILFKCLRPLVLNASRFLLKHHWMFEPFLILAYESLSCPQSDVIQKCTFCYHLHTLMLLQSIPPYLFLHSFAGYLSSISKFTEPEQLPVLQPFLKTGTLQLILIYIFKTISHNHLKWKVWIHNIANALQYAIIQPPVMSCFKGWASVYSCVNLCMSLL